MWLRVVKAINNVAYPLLLPLTVKRTTSMPLNTVNYRGKLAPFILSLMRRNG